MCLHRPFASTFGSNGLFVQLGCCDPPEGCEDICLATWEPVRTVLVRLVKTVLTVSVLFALLARCPAVFYVLA